MRRTGVFLMAAGYTLSFLVVCLGVCFAEGPSGEHACCEDGEGLSAPRTDCCSVMPGVSQALAAAPTVEPPAVLFRLAVTDGALRLRAPGSSPAVTPSPPLVLRI